MKRKLLMVQVILAVLFAQHAAAAPPATELPSVHPSVSLVETFGLWEHDGRHGNFRLVVTKTCSPEHCFDRAYLQWLEAIAGAEGRYERTDVLRTVDLRELGDFAVVHSISLSPTPSDQNRFELRTANTYTLEERRLCVLPADPGKYSIQEGACPAASSNHGANHGSR